MSEEVKAKVLAYLDGVQMAKGRDIATAIGQPKSDVDKAIAELSKEDKIEFLYLGTSYVSLKGKYKG